MKKEDVQDHVEVGRRRGPSSSPDSGADCGEKEMPGFEGYGGGQ
jgi:hypothetical protein